MLRTNLIIAATTVALLASAGCKKTGEEGAGGGAGKAANALAGPAAASGFAFPKETGVMIGFSFAKLKASKLWSMIEGQAMANPDFKQGLAEAKTECNIDAMSAVDSVTLAFESAEMKDDKALLVVVKSNLKETQVNDCITKMVEKKGGGKKVAIKKDGKITEYAPEGEDDKVYVAWLDGSFVFSPKRELLASALDGSSNIKDNAAMSALLGKVDTSGMLYGAVMIPAGGNAADQFTALGAKPDGAYGSFSLTKELDGNIGLRFANEADAKKTADTINQQLEGQKANPMVGEYLKGVVIAAAGADTTIKIKLTEQQLDSLLAMAQMMMPGAGGGGMAPPPGGM